MNPRELEHLIRLLEVEIGMFPEGVLPEVAAFHVRSYVVGYNNGARRGLMTAVTRLRELHATAVERAA